MRLRHICVTSTLLSTLVVLAPLTVVSAAPTSAAVGSRHRVIQLWFRDGSGQTVQLNGVGCDESICSRTIVNTRAVGRAAVDHTRLDEIALVRDINDGDAVVVLKDGSTRRVSVVPDNRVLYVIGADGRRQKIRLGQLTSIQFDVHQSE
jgi:hypothetical protein